MYDKRSFVAEMYFVCDSQHVCVRARTATWAAYLLYRSPLFVLALYLRILSMSTSNDSVKSSTQK